MALEDIPCQRSLPEKLEIMGPNFSAKPYVPSRSVKASSAFRGVSAQGARWRARICVNKVEYTIGDFATQEEAARAYDIEAIKRDKLRNLNYVYKGINDTPASTERSSTGTGKRKREVSSTGSVTSPAVAEPLELGHLGDSEPKQKRIVKTKRKDPKSKVGSASPHGSCSLERLAEQAITGEATMPGTRSSHIQFGENGVASLTPSAESIRQVQQRPPASLQALSAFSNNGQTFSPQFQYAPMKAQTDFMNQPMTQWQPYSFYAGPWSTQDGNVSNSFNKGSSPVVKSEAIEPARVYEDYASWENMFMSLLKMSYGVRDIMNQDGWKKYKLMIVAGPEKVLHRLSAAVSSYNRLKDKEEFLESVSQIYKTWAEAVERAGLLAPLETSNASL